MYTIEVSQSAETDEWLEARQGLITGTKASDVALDTYAQTDIDRIADMKEQALEYRRKQLEYAEKAGKKRDEYLSAEKEANESADKLDVEIAEANAKIAEAEVHLETVAAERSRAKWQKQLDVYKKKLDTVNDKRTKFLAKAETSKTNADEQSKKIDGYKAKADDYSQKADEYEHKMAQARIDNMRLKVGKGWWEYVAEKMADPPTSEPAMDRGHRLENMNAHLTLVSLGIPDDEANFDPGIWCRDDNPSIACSPDCHENALEPTWAIECKSLSSANHLMYTVPIVAHHAKKDEAVTTLARTVLPEAVLSPETRDFDFVPPQYQAQVLQYFVVNDSLKVLYFSFYDDRIHEQGLQHIFLVIPRESVTAEISQQYERERKSLEYIDDITRLARDIVMVPEF